MSLSIPASTAWPASHSEVVVSWRGRDAAPGAILGREATAPAPTGGERPGSPDEGRRADGRARVDILA